jgi:8-oxo-dGTP pyrophosphatase MutT (NUDIX family)
MKVLQRTIAWEGKYIRVSLLTYQDAKGKLRLWESVERTNCNGIVVVIPLTIKNELIFIRQFRPVLDRYVIEFPAGLNDRHESVNQAAVRELIEETGYTSEHLEIIAEGPISSGLSTEITTVFFARNAHPASDDLRGLFKPDESEDISVFLVPLEQAYKKLREFNAAGDCIDLKIFGFIEQIKSRSHATNE